jgi:gluconate 2-dehydrogenase gamma chain
MTQAASSRRSFLAAASRLLTSAWVGSNWPAITAAAAHADHAASGSAQASLASLTARDAADVDAIAAQIVPSGATPGAREAHALQFIDRALATFFADWAPDFHAGLANFQEAFARASPRERAFAGARVEEQIEFLKSVEGSPFFETVRALTLLGMFSSPKYGGNFRGAGWKLLGFEDRHVFEPPFGHYDREYSGFVPYDTEKPA